MVSVKGFTTTLHILHKCSLFSTVSTLPLTVPKTDSAKARGDVGPQRPQLTRVSKHTKNLKDRGETQKYNKCIYIIKQHLNINSDPLIKSKVILITKAYLVI